MEQPQKQPIERIEDLEQKVAELQKIMGVGGGKQHEAPEAPTKKEHEGKR